LRLQAAELLRKIGNAHYRLEQYSQAIEPLQRAGDLAQETGDAQLAVYAYLDLGLSLHGLEQYDRALETFQRVVTTAQAIEHAQLESSGLLGISLVYYSLEEYEQTLEFAERALAIAREMGDTNLETGALQGMAGAYYALGQPQQAIALLQQAPTAGDTDPQQDANVLRLLGGIHLMVGQYPQAKEFYAQALAIAQETGDRPLEIQALGDLAGTYGYTGDYQQAQEFYQQALTIAQDSDDRQQEVSLLSKLSMMYSMLGQSDQAKTAIEQAQAIAEEVQNRQLDVEVLSGLMMIHILAGQTQQARAVSQEVLAIAQELDNPTAAVQALVSLGTTYLAIGEYQQAIETYHQALEFAQKTDSPLIENLSASSLGNVYTMIGQYQQALAFHQQALEYAKAANLPYAEALALSAVGQAYYSLGQYQRAIDAYQQALAIAQTTNIPVLETVILSDLGLVHFTALDQPQQAINHYQQALEIARNSENRTVEVGLLNKLGIAHFSQGRSEEAIALLQQALTLAQESEFRGEEANILDSLGVVLLNNEQFSEAAPYFFDAIEILESLRVGLDNLHQVSIFEQQTDAYNNLQATLVAQDKSEEALEIAERGRARAFVELLSRRIAPTTAENSSMDESSIAPSSPSISQIQQIARAQNATLVKYSIIENELKHDNVGGELFIWVIKPTGEISFRRVDMAEVIQEPSQSSEAIANQTARSSNSLLKSLVSGTRNAISTDRSTEQSLSAESTHRLRELHQLLIDPIVDLLPDDSDERVIFIPHNDLFLVPFPALQDANGTYLIEKHTMLTAPSIQVLELTRERRQQLQGNGLQGNGQANEVLIVGNPAMPEVPVLPGGPPQPLSNLPAAEWEAEEIAQFFNTQALKGSEATETAIVQRMPQAQIIHLATHGLLNYGQPQAFGVQDIPGAVALAPSESDDGLLTSAEILEMNLKAELVVLSACDTGRGEITGDGVIGLSRSFFAAGVPSVVVSLWAVPDTSTAELMTEFYRQLQQNSDKAQALRQAMLITMERYPHPVDWAAFTLIGESE